jgi:taurine dioxygenase
MVLDIKPLDQPVGAVVQGWKAKMALSATDEGLIRAALRDYQVLVFCGHAPPYYSELIGFASRFGDLVRGSEWFGDIDPQPEIRRVNNLIGDDGVPQGTGASEALEWQSDYSYVPAVGKESFLEAIEIPHHDQPLTYFCRQYDAFNRLPRAMVEMPRSLRAHHSITSYVAGSEDEEAGHTPDAGEDFRKGFQAKLDRDRHLGRARPRIPEAEHPIITRHPETGREISYVSKGITRHVVGLPKDESAALLKGLAAHSTKPECLCGHDWQPGDMIMCYTLGTLHRRDAWGSSERRAMRRLSTCWTPPAEAAAF